MKNSESEFKVLDEISHVLERPGMYLGQTACIKREMWILNESENKFEYKEIEYSPALDKIFNEILDNCVDVAVESNFKKIHSISIKMDKTSFSCQDDGPGIPVKILESDPKKRSCVELAWTQMRAGTSFNEDRRGPSANGIGSTASNIFSKVFKGVSDDGKLQQKITCKDNMSSIKASEFKPSSGKSGVSVYLEPDISRFGGLTEITQAHIDLIHQRLVNLSVLFPELRFKFNGSIIKLTRKQFAGMFSKDFCLAQTDNAMIIVFKNEYDEFKYFSYVNGLNAIRGGTHVEYVINSIVNPIRDKLIKKYKSIRPGDIRSKLGLVLFLSDIPNLQFDAQTKESISNSPSEIKQWFGDKVDFERIAKEVLKNSNIIEQIEETFKLKEEVKNRIALKHSTNAKVKISPDKFISPIGNEKKILCIAEGFSAATGLSSAIGRKGIGMYAGRGVPINAWTSKTSDILKNKEFLDIMKILEIDPTTKNTDIAYDTIVQANDSDVDGIRIAGLYFGWWLKFCPDIFNKGKVARLMTPYVVLWEDQKMTKIYKAFYSLNEFKEYETKHNISKYKKNLYKGLGSWSKEQFQKLFESSPNGVYDFLEYIKLDEDGKLYVDNWLNDSMSDKRKEYLRAFNFDIENA